MYRKNLSRDDLDYEVDVQMDMYRLSAFYGKRGTNRINFKVLFEEITICIV